MSAEDGRTSEMSAIRLCGALTLADSVDIMRVYVYKIKSMMK
ncbi:hypothetical protein HNR77_003065 [Paenibacillus sp. JGP012]|nr:hypothetical protein [Paenibacillus sp. JGP012]